MERSVAMRRKVLIFLLALAIGGTALLGMATCSADRSAATAAAGRQSVELPIVMYHSVINDPNRAGKYIVTPAQLEQDLRYLKERGYTTVTVSEVIAFVNGTGALPEKPVMITFDDGNYNNYVYLYPLLEKYDMKAVISVIGLYSDLYSQSEEAPNANYSNLTWEQMREMEASGRVEIQNHSYNMHGNAGRQGVRQEAGESSAHYLAAIREDLEKMQQRMEEELGHRASAFAYPFGAVTEEAKQVVREEGIQATLSSYEHVSTVTQGDKESLFDLGRYNRAAGKSAAEFFATMKIL